MYTVSLCGQYTTKSCTYKPEELLGYINCHYIMARSIITYYGKLQCQPHTQYKDHHMMSSMHESLIQLYRLIWTIQLLKSCYHILDLYIGAYPTTRKLHYTMHDLLYTPILACVHVMQQCHYY